MRKTIDISSGNRVRDARENNGDRARFTQQCSKLSGKAGEDHVRRGTHEVDRVAVPALVIAADPALVEADVAAVGPAALLEALMSASFGLAGCSAIDELKEAFLRWIESEKPPRPPAPIGQPPTRV